MFDTSSVCLFLSTLGLYFSGDTTASSRVKRYVAFPRGTSFTVTIAMSTFLPKEVLLKKVPTGLAHIVEYDFGYKFPDRLAINKPPTPPKPKKKKVPLLIQVPDSRPWVPEYYSEFPEKRKWKTKRRGRMLDQLSQAIDRFGYKGEICIERLSCEAHQHLSWGRSLLEDLILAVVPIPKSSGTCSSKILQDCSISILQIILHSEPVNELGE